MRDKIQESKLASSTWLEEQRQLKVQDGVKKLEADAQRMKEEEKVETMMQYLSSMEENKLKRRRPKMEEELQQNKTWKDRVCSLE